VAVGTVVTTDYKGVTVIASVASHNVGKNVLVLRPTTPTSGVPHLFTKSPKLVKPHTD
jgi:hypothetical protein